MSSNICPLCSRAESKNGSEGCKYFECDVCRGIYIDSRLVRAPTTIDDWSGPFCAACELRDQYSFPAKIRFDGSAVICDENSNEITITSFPRTISGRAHKLLSALVRRGEFFGDQITLTPNDYPLAYVNSDAELRPFVDFLEEAGLVSIISRTSHDINLRVNAAGFEAVESSSLLPELTVFLSSTCHDLRDCRCELKSHLESLRCIVRVSDDPLSFDVSATDDSIQSCLLNVQKSNVVFCLIDQRYGPPLADGEYAGISATHAEIRFARSQNIPVFFFIRRDAFSEWSILKRNPSAKTNWVEPTSEPRRQLWTSFVSEYALLPTDKGISNWFDQFNSVVDLKQIMSFRVRQLQNQSQ